MFSREAPVGGPVTNRSYRYSLSDPYLLFWFRYIYPNRSLIEQGAVGRLVERIRETLPDYIGRHVLESHFKKNALGKL